MSLLSEQPTSAELGDRLREAYAVTAEFMSDIIRSDLPALSLAGQSAKTARIERLIQSAPGPMRRWR